VGKEVTKMTVTASQGPRPIPINVAIATIRRIINLNPVVKTAVDNLVAGGVSREQAVFDVYDVNYVFWQEVDWKLNEL